VVTTAAQLQFPDTSQLGGLCGGLLGGSAFTGGLVASGDSSQGTAGALVTGTQGLLDNLCGFMGGTGVNTTPEAVTTGAGAVHGAVSGSPMAAGTIALGGSSGNTALDAINGIQNLSNTLFNILSLCGCGANLNPNAASPQQVIDTTQQTADGINGSPMASGIIAMGQDPTGTGNVALDAINGLQNFSNALMSILTLCGCGSTFGTGQLGLLGIGAPYTATNVSPQTVIGVAQAVSDAVTGNPFANDLLGGGSGNIAADALSSGQDLANQVHTAVSGSLAGGASLQDIATSGSQAINQNTSNHVGNQSLTTAQSVALKEQNLLVSQDFSSAYTIVAQDHWSWDGTDGAPSTNVLGCAAVTCDGTQDPLVSSEIPVVVGENIEVAAEVKWSGLTYTGGSPLILSVEKYRLTKAANGQNVYADVGWKNVYTVPAPGSSSTGWLGISGNYVVEAGVDQLRFRLDADKRATAGTVKWDAANFLKLDLIASECVPGVGLTVDNIVTQLYGTIGSGFTQNASANALANTATSLVSVTSRVAALEAEGHTGTIAGDDFNWSGEIVASANWGGSYVPSGLAVYQADGVDATWVLPAFSFTNPATQYAYFDWQGTGATSTTDYQLVQLILDSAPQQDINCDAYIYLYGRISAGWTSNVFARIGSDRTWLVGYNAGSGPVTMAAGNCDVPGKGALISFYIGDAPTAAPRHYRLEVGSKILAEFDEVGTGSALGATFRKWGWGALVEGFILSRSIPPNVNQWLGMDQ
jgi:hypothetical protein